MGDRQEIAKEAYKQIVKAIQEVEDKYPGTFELPEWIKVDGQIFYKRDLHIFSKHVPDEIFRLKWKNKNHRELKDLFLDFQMECLHHFRDKEPFQISLKEAMDYVEEFVKERWEGK